MSDFVVTAIIAAYNEADVIGVVVADLVDQGIRVYLIDNHSTDGTVEAVRPYEGRGLIGVERFPPDGEAANTFPWRRILERKVALSRELESDWFIHHDADEFRESPWIGVNLLDGIRRVDALGYTAIDFQVFNFWAAHDRFQPGDDPREAFVAYEAGQAWDAAQIKCWKNVEDVVDLADSGGHEVVFASRNVFPLRFLLRHYPLRGTEHGRRKILTERVPRFLEEERARGWHVQYDALKDNPGLRDPASLVPYDPVDVRIQLSLGSRAVESALKPVEEARGRLEEHRAALGEQLADEQHARAELEARRKAEVDALKDQVRDLESARRHFADEEARLSAEVERLEGARAALETQCERLEAARVHEATQHARTAGEVSARLDALEAANAELSRRLGEVYASQSWRLTSPLRASLDIMRVLRPGGNAKADP